MGRKILRVLFGPEPKRLLFFLAPTGIAFAIDVVLRASALIGYAPQGKAIYLSSLAVSAAFWLLPSWWLSKLRTRAEATGTGRARAAMFALLAFFFALTALAFPAQIVYRRVFGIYMGRDTLRLGIMLRGTVGEWFLSWSGPLLVIAMITGGLAMASIIFRAAKRAGVHATWPPLVAIVLFPASIATMWIDMVDSRFLQAATPDVCFIHGVVHATRAAVTGQWQLRQGMSVRNPAPLPPLTTKRERIPNVLVILTESVRADASCSSPPPLCARASAFDSIVPDRIALGKLTSQTPNTFSSFMVLTTGLSPNAPFAAAHEAPVLWELAHALSRRTIYVSSQNPNFEDFGLFVKRASIDDLVMAPDLGGLGQEQLGAPDERATARLEKILRERPAGEGFFALLHLSNTHAPYRTDPSLLPYQPETTNPVGDVNEFSNHYKNSIALQERTIAELLSHLSQRPDWNDTVVVFLSDHGEQFREHGGLYHNHTLFDEELRIPGWLWAGSRTLSQSEKEAILSYATRRAYTQDVNGTLLDILGIYEQRSSLAHADLMAGRSLLRGRTNWLEPQALLATSTAVWEPDDARFGVMQGEEMLVGAPHGGWLCYSMARDSRQLSPKPDSACADILPRAQAAYPIVK